MPALSAAVGGGVEVGADILCATDAGAQGGCIDGIPLTFVRSTASMGSAGCHDSPLALQPLGQRWVV
jgi:hypothetical protein